MSETLRNLIVDFLVLEWSFRRIDVGIAVVEKTYQDGIRIFGSDEKLEKALSEHLLGVIVEKEML